VTHPAAITCLASNELYAKDSEDDDDDVGFVSIVVSGATDGSLFISDLEDAESARELQGHVEEVTALCILPRQRRVVSASFDGFATIWSVDTEDRIPLNGHQDRVTQLCAIDRGKRVASSCHSGHVYVWCSITGSLLWSMEVGYEFASALSLERYAIASCWGMNAMSLPSTKIRSCPYFSARGDELDELSVVSALDREDVVARCVFDAPITALDEVWSQDASGKRLVYIVVGLETGTVLLTELVTTFGAPSRSFRKQL
jgi:WD40 repeat protein